MSTCCSSSLLDACSAPRRPPPRVLLPRTAPVTQAVPSDSPCATIAPLIRGHGSAHSSHAAHFVTQRLSAQSNLRSVRAGPLHGGHPGGARLAAHASGDQDEFGLPLDAPPLVDLDGGFPLAPVGGGVHDDEDDGDEDDDDDDGLDGDGDDDAAVHGLPPGLHDDDDEDGDGGGGGADLHGDDGDEDAHMHDGDDHDDGAPAALAPE